MTFVAPESAPLNAARIPSIVVLGADALLAALPATPVQLAHACVRAGYQSVVPASWGDELIAVASVRALQQHGQLPAIQCSCPHVAHRLLAVGTDLRPFLLSLVAPPVLLAQYLRSVGAPGKLRITYVGRCPGAVDESIDARLTPEELLAIIADRQILLDEQPRVYDSVIPPDRRRYRSQPGGLPTPDMLWSGTDNGATGARTLVELHGDDLPVELAQHLLAGKPALIDCAPKLGCVCSGAVPGVDAADARSRVTMLEPPRAANPVVDEQLIIDATLPLPASPRNAIDVVSPPAGIGSSHRFEPIARMEDRPRAVRHEQIGMHAPPATEASRGALASSPSRRPSPGRGIARPTAGTLPIARDAEGRQLPRTYVALRRAPSRGPRNTTPASGVVAQPPEPRPNQSETTAAPNTNAPIGSGEAPMPSPSERETATLRRGKPQVTGITEVLAGGLELESTPPSRGRQAVPNEDITQSDPQRYAERPVALPVTPRSDAPRRQEAVPQAAGERPIMQLLTLGLLISMIVLVSAAVGVLVGRWMTQH
jgi:hypothetical protein